MGSYRVQLLASVCLSLGKVIGRKPPTFGPTVTVLVGSEAGSFVYESRWTVEKYISGQKQS